MGAHAKTNVVDGDGSTDVIVQRDIGAYTLEPDDKDTMNAERMQQVKTYLQTVINDCERACENGTAAL